MLPSNVVADVTTVCICTMASGRVMCTRMLVCMEIRYGTCDYKELPRNRVASTLSTANSCCMLEALVPACADAAITVHYSTSCAGVHADLVHSQSVAGSHCRRASK